MGVFEEVTVPFLAPEGHEDGPEAVERSEQRGEQAQHIE